MFTTILLMITGIGLVIALLYLLAIMPRMLHKPDFSPLQGFHYAHRGLHDNAGDTPENSLPAFRQAIEAGYGIELDLQLTKDGEVVIFHDDNLERVCGAPGLISDYTYGELQKFRLFTTNEQIPRFRDFLSLVAGRVPLIVELKVAWQDTSICPAADSLLREYKGVYCVESFNPLALIWYKNHHPEIIRGQLSDRFFTEKGKRTILYGVLEHLLLNWVTRPDFIAFNHQYAGMLSRRLCRRLYRNPAVAWTIKSQAEMTQAGAFFDLFIFEGFLPEMNDKNKHN